MGEGKLHKEWHSKICFDLCVLCVCVCACFHRMAYVCCFLVPLISNRGISCFVCDSMGAYLSLNIPKKMVREQGLQDCGQWSWNMVKDVTHKQHTANAACTPQQDTKIQWVHRFLDAEFRT